MVKDSHDAAYDFGFDTLGPAFHEYLADLDQNIRHFATDQGAKILFVARAGVRIRKLYRAYLQGIGSEEPEGLDYFWNSRFLSIKGTWQECSARGSALVAKEFATVTIRDVVAALFRSAGLPSDLSLDEEGLGSPGATFNSFIWGPTHAAHLARWHLAEQSERFETYIEQIRGGAERIVLVDSGWQGTTQNMLSDWRSELDWWGLYFGRSGTAESDRRNWSRMIGLVFEEDDFDPAVPKSSVILHRHLIESILEPNAPSIEHLDVQGNGTVFAPGASALLNEHTSREEDPIYTGILDYVSRLPRGRAPMSVARESQAAWQHIARIITAPTPDEVRAISLRPRSADFGREIEVPVALEPIDRFEGDSPEGRISHSLWPQAQAVLEYPADLAPARLKQLLKDATLAAGRKLARQRPARAVGKTRPAVAVITRTMDRPIFLKRALESVSQQTFQDYLHVIVCDGGPIEPVRAAVEQSGADLRKLILIDNVSNRGMEATSNIGIRNSDSDHIVIHDDDDTWHPEFLARTVSYLESKDGKKYGGVITGTTYVSEEVLPQGIKIHRQQPYNDWVDQVQLGEMACNNFFAPICFVFKRSIYDEVGGFDERFPVLGDWDFNIRFLRLADIGVMRTPLAYYHHRDVGNRGLFSNSVIGDIDKHAEFNAIMRNKYIREGELNIGGPGGPLVALGSLVQDLRSTARRTFDLTSAIPEVWRKQESASNPNWSVLSDERWILLQMERKERLRAEEAVRNAAPAPVRTLDEGAQAEIAQLKSEVQSARAQADSYWIALSLMQAERSLSDGGS